MKQHRITPTSKMGSPRIHWMAAATFFTTAALAVMTNFGDSMSALPEDKQAYVGHWQAPGVELQLTQEGRVNYVTRNGPTSKTVSALVRKFDGASFEAGVWILAEDFTVSEPPGFRDGRWSMTVNGVKLHRAP